MHGVPGKLALLLVAVALKRGTEQKIQLYMVVLIVQEVMLKTKPAMLIPVHMEKKDQS